MSIKKFQTRQEANAYLWIHIHDILLVEPSYNMWITFNNSNGTGKTINTNASIARLNIHFSSEHIDEGKN